MAVPRCPRGRLKLHTIDVHGWTFVDTLHADDAGGSGEGLRIRWLWRMISCVKQFHESLVSTTRGARPWRSMTKMAAATIERAMTDPALMGPVVEYHTIRYPIDPGSKA